MSSAGLTSDASDLPALAPLDIGQEVLDGRLVVRGVLGQGAMGVVYRADDRLLGRPVALKTLATFDADELYQLKRGFRTLAGVSHRNLVQLYELGASGPLWFLIMELIEGVELTGWLRHQPSSPRVLRVFGELAEALRALHTAGLMHGDVKPANVMVVLPDHTVLLDFGLTAPIRAAGNTLSAGTLDYMAPEQLWGESPGAAADWYSFGVMLFEALTGRLPFTGPDRLRAMRRGLRAGPRALSPDVPVDLDQLITGLLAPDPRDRPEVGEIGRLFGLSHGPHELATPLEEAPFVGREDTLSQLHHQVLEARRGEPRLVHLHGPSGIGKTAIVRRFLSEILATTDAVVLEGACHPQESVPYNALDGIVDNLARHLLALEHSTVLALAPGQASALLEVFPILGRVPGVREWPARPLEPSPSDVRRRGGEALREILSRLAERSLVVVWIDDVQWSDRDSGAMLHSLLAPPEAPRLLVLLTSRDDHGLPPLVVSLAEKIPRTEIALSGLTDADSRVLAGTLAGGAGIGLDLDRVTVEAGGSPFLLGELVRYLREPPADQPVPGALTIRHALGARLRRLAPESRRLLEHVAIAGKPLELDLALSVAGLEPAGRLLAYSLCSASLLRISTQDERQFLEAYHDRLREFAIENMGGEAARAGHRALAGAMAASRTPDPRAVVRHLLEAEEHRDAARFAIAAAQDAARDLAFDQAVEMCDIALAHGPDVQDDAVLRRRADMLAYAGRRSEAALAYEATAAAAEARGEAHPILRIQAAEQFLHGGELKQGLAAMATVLGDVGIRVPYSPLGRSLKGLWHRACFIVRGPAFIVRDPVAIDSGTATRLDALWRTARGMVMLDPVLADVLAGEHLRESLRRGDASRAVRALGLEAAIEANIGGKWLRRRSERLLAAADAVAATHGTSYDRAWLAQSRAACVFFAGRWRESLALGHAAEALLRPEPGGSWDLAAVHGFMLSALANLGELQELATRSRELVQDAERRRDQYALRVFRTGDAVLIWLAADQVEMALELAEGTLVDYQADHFTSQHRHHMVATVQAQLYAGRPERAWERVERAWPLLRRAGFLLMDCLGTQLRYLRGCTAVMLACDTTASRRARLIRAARHEGRRIARSDQPMGAPMAQVLAAAVAGLEGDRDAQGRALLAAAAGFEQAEMGLHSAAARWQAGSAGLAPRANLDAGAAWMARQGILHPARMARAVVPAT